MAKTKIGIVGCGNISGIYFTNCAKLENVEIAACADLVKERAEEKARQFNVPRVCPVEDILADKEIRIVLNLTIPKAHASVAQAAVEAGKSVYNEKPLTITRDEGKNLLKTAAKNKVLVGGAPDTFLGAGIQTCRKLIEDGAIGDVIGATAFMTCHGHEGWHPDPEFYYEVGGGPMFDMGPYYLTALVSLVGPVARVTGSARVTFPTRTIGSEKKRGKVIKVDVPTHIAGVMDFANGAVGTIITSFDVWAANLPRIEIFGAEGSLSVPDPNGFGGPVRLAKAGAGWEDVKLTHPYDGNWRGLGVADMAMALTTGRKHRANGEMAYHVLDLMHAFHDASQTGKHVKPESTCELPAPMPTGLTEGRIDE